MRTFIARLPRRWLVAAVLVPPAAFAFLLEGVVKARWAGEVGPATVFGLIALAWALPLAALAYTLLSAAAYSVAGDRLIIHRVVGDRELSLRQLQRPPVIGSGGVQLEWPGARMQLHTENDAGCAEAIAAVFVSPLPTDRRDVA